MTSKISQSTGRHATVYRASEPRRVDGCTLNPGKPTPLDLYAHEFDPHLRDRVLTRVVQSGIPRPQAERLVDAVRPRSWPIVQRMALRLVRYRYGRYIETDVDSFKQHNATLNALRRENPEALVVIEPDHRRFEDPMVVTLVLQDQGLQHHPYTVAGTHLTKAPLVGGAVGRLLSFVGAIFIPQGEKFVREQRDSFVARTLQAVVSLAKVLLGGSQAQATSDEERRRQEIAVSHACIAYVVEAAQALMYFPDGTRCDRGERHSVGVAKEMRKNTGRPIIKVPVILNYRGPSIEHGVHVAMGTPVLLPQDDDAPVRLGRQDARRIPRRGHSPVAIKGNVGDKRTDNVIEAAAIVQELSVRGRQVGPENILAAAITQLRWPVTTLSDADLEAAVDKQIDTQRIDKPLPEAVEQALKAIEAPRPAWVDSVLKQLETLDANMTRPTLVSVLKKDAQPAELLDAAAYVCPWVNEIFEIASTKRRKALERSQAPVEGTFAESAVLERALEIYQTLTPPPSGFATPVGSPSREGPFVIDLNVATARNQLTATLNKAKATWLKQVDSSSVCVPRTSELMRMAGAAEAAYPRRRFDWLEHTSVR